MKCILSLPSFVSAVVAVCMWCSLGWSCDTPQERLRPEWRDVSHQRPHRTATPTPPTVAFPRCTMSAGASPVSSATDVERDHDVGADTDPPQLSALFLIRFDKKVGYVILEACSIPKAMSLLTNMMTATRSLGNAQTPQSRSMAPSNTSRSLPASTRSNPTSSTLCMKATQD